MSDNTKNLMEVLNEYEVRIPVLQRDYAQGRESAKNIREHLLDDIYTNLNKTDAVYDLNFIYGNVKDGVFYPVDGQQRLTSLYLIYWFLEKSIKKEFWKENIKITSLKKFTYMTRNSAIDFFEFMRSNESDNLYEILVKKECSIPGVFDNYWFKEAWKNDPTIEAALNFLISIAESKNVSKEEREGEKRDFTNDSEKLYRNMNNIRFSFLIAESEKAEEEAAKIYIRMNNRGKKLSEFENLKAIIDKIECKYSEYISKDVNFVDTYNLTYEPALYDMVSKGGTSDELVEHTNKMDMYSYKIICILYCIAFKKEIKTYNCVDVVEELYKVSSNVDSDKGEKVRKFFSLISKFFIYITQIRNDLLWRELLDVCISAKNVEISLKKKEIAAVLYIENVIVDTKQDDINQFEKVSTWIMLDTGKTECFYEIITKWIDEVKNDSNIYSYFTNMKDVSNDVLVKAQITPSIGRDMECIRCIATDYLIENPGIEYSRYNKTDLSYLLYVADFWRTSNRYDSVIVKYCNKVQEYFSKNDYKWRAWYAITSCIDKTSGQFISADVNQFFIQNKHIWDKNCKMWNGYEPDVEKKEGLDKAKTAYQKLIANMALRSTIAKEFNSQNFEEMYMRECKKIPTNTWMYYLVNAEFGNKALILLSERLEISGNRLLFSKNKNYSVIVMSTMIRELEYQIFDLHSNAKFSFEWLNSHYNWGEDSTISASRSEPFTFWAGRNYEHSNRTDLKYSSTNNRNIKLIYEYSITLKKSELEKYLHTEFNDNGKLFCLNWDRGKLNLIYGEDTLYAPEIKKITLELTNLASSVSKKLDTKVTDYQMYIQDTDCMLEIYHDSEVSSKGSCNFDGKYNERKESDKIAVDGNYLSSSIINYTENRLI